MKKSIVFNLAVLITFAASMSGILLSIVVADKELLTLFTVTSIAIVGAAVVGWSENLDTEQAPRRPPLCLDFHKPNNYGNPNSHHNNPINFPNNFKFTCFH